MTSIPFAAGRNASAHNTPRTNRKLHLQEASKAARILPGAPPQKARGARRRPLVVEVGGVEPPSEGPYGGPLRA